MVKKTVVVLLVVLALAEKHEPASGSDSTGKKATKTKPVNEKSNRSYGSVRLVWRRDEAEHSAWALVSTRHPSH